MQEWVVIIEVWPFSGVDQKLAGPRTSTFRTGLTQPTMFREAAQFAKAVQVGMKANPQVWEAPIVSVAFG